MSLLSPERRYFLITLDTLFVNTALFLSIGLRPDYSLNIRLLLDHPTWYALLSTLWLLLAYAFDAYDFRVVAHFSEAALAVLKAGFVTMGLYLIIPYLSPALPGSRWHDLVLILLVPLFLLVGRGFYHLVLRRTLFHRRVLIIGAGWAGRTIAEALTEVPNIGFNIVGFIDDNPKKLGQEISFTKVSASVELVETSVLVNIKEKSETISEISSEKNRAVRGSRGFCVLGDRYALKDLITEHNITTLVQAITYDSNGEMLAILMDCLELGVEIIPMPLLYEALTGKVPIEHIGDNWYVAMPTNHPGTRRLRPVVKRLFDIVSSSFGLFFLGLATPFIALAIYLDSSGPIFYTQERIGRGGKMFRVYKFRSMIIEAEKKGAVWATEGDSRITRVGKFLRKTHVDEFPQFLNILKGEMSAVGPRPERPEFVKELAQEIPFYRVRHAVKPGMAGWGLVNQGYGSSKEDALIKLQYDLYYIKHQSLWLDVVILLKTILDTLSFGGR